MYEVPRKRVSGGRETVGAFLVALVLSSFGCGGQNDNRMQVYPVTGTVTVKGQPAEGATVVFFIADEAKRGPAHPLPTGVTGPDGKFSLRSYGKADGAPAGEYLVTIVWPEVDKSTDPEKEAPSQRDRLRDRYAVPNQSGLTAAVGTGPTELPPFDLP